MVSTAKSACHGSGRQALEASCPWPRVWEGLPLHSLYCSSERFGRSGKPCGDKDFHVLTKDHTGEGPMLPPFFATTRQ